MKPFQANIVNALVLIVLGVWGYLSADPAVRSFTALIAPIFGVVFLLLTAPFRAENKVVAHVVVLLTFLLLVMLAVMPLPKRFAADDTVGAIRIIIMIVSCAWAMWIYIGSFRAARKAREAGQ